MKSIGTFKQSRGAVAPLVAIMLIVIVVCVALVVDLGHIHNVKVELQRAVDAAALAGAGQLNSSTGSGQTAIDVAVATAAANTADQNPVNIDEDAIANPNFKGMAIKMVQPISWNKNITDPDSGNTLTTADRITPLAPAQYDTANAVWVTAQMTVPHVFFFFVDSTNVTADAIAVNIFEEETLPFVLVSCIQTDDTYLKPGQTVCDIQNFKWGSDSTDTAGWTSLTYRPVNKPTIENFFSSAGVELFNEVVYGTDSSPKHDGLENEDVSQGPLPFDVAKFTQPFNTQSAPCNERNVETNIVCGLGDTFSEIIPAPLPDDPLSYGNTNSLPRWSDDDFSSGFNPSKDFFMRIWSMDGVMYRRDHESLNDFESRMQALQNASVNNDYSNYELTYNKDIYGEIKPEFKDGRFGTQVGGKVVGVIGKGPLPLRESDGKSGSVSSDTAPLYEEVLRYAGYPLVEVSNGEVSAALGDFLHGNNKGLTPIVNPTTHEFLDKVIAEHFPFDETGSVTSYGKGETLLLTLPVIFTGICDTTKFNKGMPYIGLSNILVTRIWKNQNDGYDAGDDSVTVIGTPSTCSFDNFNPPNPGTLSQRFVFVKGKKSAIEGLVLAPTVGEETIAGIRKIYLVE